MRQLVSIYDYQQEIKRLKKRLCCIDCTLAERTSTSEPLGGLEGTITVEILLDDAVVFTASNNYLTVVTDINALITEIGVVFFDAIGNTYTLITESCSNYSITAIND